MRRFLRSVLLLLTLRVGVACLDGAHADQAQYFYDALGRLSAVVDGQGNAAIYTYDAVYFIGKLIVKRFFVG